MRWRRKTRTRMRWWAPTSAVRAGSIRGGEGPRWGLPSIRHQVAFLQIQIQIQIHTLVCQSKPSFLVILLHSGASSDSWVVASCLSVWTFGSISLLVLKNIFAWHKSCNNCANVRVWQIGQTVSNVMSGQFHRSEFEFTMTLAKWSANLTAVQCTEHRRIRYFKAMIPGSDRKYARGWSYVLWNCHWRGSFGCRSVVGRFCRICCSINCVWGSQLWSTSVQGLLWSEGTKSVVFALWTFSSSFFFRFTLFGWRRSRGKNESKPKNLTSKLDVKLKSRA